ncbi:mercury(II) reductase [Sulfolobus sp. E1]|uniref:mercury(II) reductase n=2 Tax=Sulfolobaceae TaxID=118883 RepID=UPI000845F67C|nr:mercury(II) reductase [Sulfolobus sp. A20]TRM73676.1 mercury(II) reductase [Sulfolobus sp. E5]TRM75197.1 mercury(II) reductase [Sulfolobus sp. A20-N-F8]TRM79649.1 mercury(II) reductase [Sulfolobus sp. B5]TRM84434.1 mercury(II) reductase [Sulfolobus sp. F3]TRM88373.1 mercury(II) reductase [Sulfolobus sp. E3]TRN00501.1 mercury(II) reductase [Sulfolobus sp. E1]TRN04644.1 mercury(II) reductase [Sulfolobus sp. F1]
MEDLVVIGYGAAGFAAIIRANELGVKPVLVGHGEIGGTCVNVGCVPSKRMLRIGELYNYASKILGNQIYPDFFKSFEDKSDIVSKLRKEKYENVLDSYDVKLINGKAHFISPNSIKVNGEVIEAKKFIICTGSSTYIPDIKGLREAGYWTNIEALSPDRKIESLAIIGGRALALEFAQMYKRLGVDTIILQRSKLIIPDWEPEISLVVKEYLEEYDHIPIMIDVRVKEIVKKEHTKVIVTDKGEVEADEILLATGRRPNVDLNLPSAGVELNERGGIKVDDELKSSNPNIYAAGDVIGDLMLESLAGKEGAIAAENAILNSHRKIDRLSIPQAIFIEPNAARVGLTQIEAEKKGYQIDYRVVKMDNVAKARILRESEGLIKMVIDKKFRTILGVQMFGKYAAEVINEAALAIKFRATIDDIIDTIHVFPTMSESLKIVAMSFVRDVSRMSCCVD